MLIFLWQQNNGAGTSAELDAEGDSECTFVGAEVVAGELGATGDSECTFESDSHAVIPIVPPPGGPVGIRRRPRLRPVARPYADLEADGDSRSQIAAASTHRASFSAVGESSASLVARAASAGSFTSAADSALDAPGLARARAGLDAIGDSDVRLDGAASATARFDAEAASDSAIAAASVSRAAMFAGGDSEAGFAAAGTSAARLVAIADSTAAFGIVANQQAEMSAVGDSAFVARSSVSAAAQWITGGLVDVRLAPIDRRAALFIMIGEADVIITGLEHGTFEAAIRRVTESFGRRVVEASTVRADEAPPPIAPAANYVMLAHRFTQPRRQGRPPRGKPSGLHEAEYARRLIAWIGELRGELSALPRLLPVRQDESRHGGRVREITEPVRRKVARDLVRLEPEVERTGRSVAAASKQMLDRQTRAVLGVEIPTRDERIPSQIDAFVSKNMTRIRSLGDKLIGEVEAIVIDAWDKGLSQGEVAALIAARVGVAESYARFLARDQMGALYSQVTRARHEEIGVRLFRWWTEDDGNVRPSHAVKHGKVFPYRGSRAPSFLPGMDYGCRCWEEPVLDEIRAQAFAGRGRARVA